ncbi:MAG: hypothetical protein P8Q97_00180 [Myxococcota bacterium]|jgi:hypothetical protein|nr:hypothetical protein [Myxococcota bacterium]
MKPPLLKKICPKQLGKFVAVLALVCLASEPARSLETRAVSGPVEIRVELTPDHPVIGDAITLRIEAIAEPDVEILMPAFGEALDRFRIVDFVPRESLTEDGKTLHSQRYTLQAPASGEHLLPPILLEFIDHRPGHPAAPDELDAYEILTESIPFAIESMVPDSASADLSPPMEKLNSIGSDRTPWEWLVAAVFVLGLAGFFGFRAWQRWSLQAAVRSAWDVASSELEMLLASPLPQGERVNDFFVQLSGIVRRYLENRFSLRSPELTTERFLEEVIASPEFGREHQALLKDFLNQCDLVKFAHHVPSPEAIRETTQKARRFIDETRGLDEDKSSSRDEVAA